MTDLGEQLELTIDEVEVDDWHEWFVSLPPTPGEDREAEPAAA